MAISSNEFLSRIGAQGSASKMQGAGDDSDYDFPYSKVLSPNESSIMQESTVSMARPMQYQPTSSPVIQKRDSKIPEIIKESLREHPIDVGRVDNFEDAFSKRFNTNAMKTILDTSEAQVAAKKAGNNHTVQPSSPAIDYALIKTIINECLDEKLSQLSVIAIKGGTIKLVNSKGDVFSAKLEKAGNVKK